MKMLVSLKWQNNKDCCNKINDLKEITIYHSQILQTLNNSINLLSEYMCLMNTTHRKEIKILKTWKIFSTLKLGNILKE